MSVIRRVTEKHLYIQGHRQLVADEVANNEGIEENYGKFFQPQIFVQNYNKKDILVDPLKIYAQYEVKSKFFTAPIFDYKKYLSMVKKIQTD